MIRKFSAGLIFTLLAISANAANTEFSAEGLSVSDDGVTTYSGNVEVRAPAGTPYEVKSKTTRSENDVKIYEGDVEIKMNGQLIKTQKASFTTSKKGEIVIEMDLADAANL